MVAFESSLERDYCFLLEFDKRVDRYQSQPIPIRYVRPSGRRCEGFPDFLVFYKLETALKPLLVDVKPRAKLKEKWAHLRPRLLAACREARPRGWIYKLQSEVEIRIPFLPQAKFLYPYLLRVVPVPEYVDLFRTALSKATTSSPRELLASCFPSSADRPEALPTLWHLVAAGEIGADLQQPIEMDMPIWLTEAET